MVPNQLLQMLMEQGFRDQGLRNAWAIIQRESGGNPRAFNPNRATGDESYGLFQINMLGDLGPSRIKQFKLPSKQALFDARTNIRAAWELSRGGTDWGHWGVGLNAYRKTPPLDYSTFPGQAAARMANRPRKPTGGVPAPVADTPRQPKQTRPLKLNPDLLPYLTLRDLNGIARRNGFKSFADSVKRPYQQVRALTRTSTVTTEPAGDNPAGVTFKATAHKQPFGSGVAELFYDPAGSGKQWNEGSWTNPIGGHSDHVHVSFSSPETALMLIKAGQKLGLRVSENPYTDNVDPVHTTTSYHYRNFGDYGGKTLGGAIDVSGPSNLMMRFYEYARRYVG